MRASRPALATVARSTADLTPIVTLVLKYLTIHEAVDILKQFRGRGWQPGGQVLWSGMDMGIVHKWAESCDRQTLTFAMGILKEPAHAACLRREKTDKEWSQYIKGASALFTWCAVQGRDVTLVTPPPDERFHPSGMTNLQSIEGAILAGFYGPFLLERILVCHPQVEDASGFSYQLWPEDRVDLW
ncbi:hypothetical protein Micbo1qcDRAFT_126203, partial [Microdochium bolleyi]